MLLIKHYGLKTLVISRIHVDYPTVAQARGPGLWSSCDEQSRMTWLWSGMGIAQVAKLHDNIHQPLNIYPGFGWATKHHTFCYILRIMNPKRLGDRGSQGFTRNGLLISGIKQGWSILKPRIHKRCCTLLRNVISNTESLEQLLDS